MDRHLRDAGTPTDQSAADSSAKMDDSSEEKVGSKAAQQIPASLVAAKHSIPEDALSADFIDRGRLVAEYKDLASQPKTPLPLRAPVPPRVLPSLGAKSEPISSISNRAILPLPSPLKRAVDESDDKQAAEERRRIRQEHEEKLTALV